MPGPRPTSVGDVYTPTTVPGGSQSVAVASGYGSLLGWTACEMVGQTASFRLHDGQASGPAQCLTALVIVGPSQSTGDWYGPQGLAVASQVWLERVSGVTEIVVYGQ